MSLINNMLLEIDKRHHRPVGTVVARDATSLVEAVSRPWQRGLNGRMVIVAMGLILCALAWWMQLRGVALGAAGAAPALAQMSAVPAPPPASDAPSADGPAMPALRLKIDTGWCDASRGAPAARRCAQGPFKTPD